VEPSPTDDSVYKVEGGGYFPNYTRSEEGLSWRVGSSAFLPAPFGEQQLVAIPSFFLPDQKLSFVDVSRLYKGYYCVVSSRFRLNKILPGLTLYTSKRWIGKEDWSHLPIEPNDGGMGGGNLVANQIMEYMALRNKSIFVPLTSLEVARVVNVPVRIVEQYLYRLPDIFMWKQVTSGRHEWIRRLDLYYRLPDDSLSYVDALQKLVVDRELRTSVGFGYFSEFISLNGIYPSFYFKDGVSVLTLKSSSPFVRDLTVDGDVEKNPGPCSICSVENKTVINGLCFFCYSSLSARTQRNKVRNLVREEMDDFIFIEEKRLGRKLNTAEIGDAYSNIIRRKSRKD